MGEPEIGRAEIWHLPAMSIQNKHVETFNKYSYTIRKFVLCEFGRLHVMMASDSDANIGSMVNPRWRTMEDNWVLRQIDSQRHCGIAGFARNSFAVGVPGRKRLPLIYGSRNF